MGALSLATVLTAAGAWAQGTAPSGTARPGTPAAGAEQRITLDLRDVPFRTAIDALFGPTGQQFAIDPTTPNIPITVSLRDVEFSTALRVVLRQAQATYRKEGPVFMIGPRQTQAEATAAATEAIAPEAPAATAAEQTWEKIPIQFQNPTIIGYAFGAQTLPTEDQLMTGGMGGLGGGGMMGGYGLQGGMMGGLGGGMMGGLGGGIGGGLGGYGGIGGGIGGVGGGIGGGIGGLGGYGGIGGGVGGIGGVGNYGGTGGFTGRLPGRY